MVVSRLTAQLVLCCLTLAQSSLAWPLILDSESEANSNFPAVPEGYVLAAPFALTQPRVDRTVKNKDNDEKYYLFEAFPHSRVLTSSVMIIMIPTAVVLACLVMIFILRLCSDIVAHTEMSKCMNDRKVAWENLRTVGLRLDTAAEQTDPEAKGSSMDNENKATTPTAQPDTDAAQLPASSSKTDTKKDANKITGPVVPVLRNEDPAAAESDDDDDGESDTEGDPNRVL